MGTVAGVDDRAGRNASGRRLGEMFQAMFAFVAETGAARPGEFHGDPSAGPMAEDDPGQGRGDGESEVKDDRRNDLELPSRPRPELYVHPAMLARGTRPVNSAQFEPTSINSAIRMFLLSRSVPIDRSRSAWATL